MMQQQPPPQGAQPPQGSGQPAAQQLSPEQIRQMQVMSKQAMELLSEQGTSEMIVQRAEQGDPAQVIAQIVVEVTSRLFEAATNAGQKVDMVTILVTGLQIIGSLAELLAAADVVPKEQLPQFVAQASKIAVDQHNAMVQGGGAGGGQPQPQPGAPA